jgi:NH3-dependent NAD+ synthetase
VCDNENKSYFEAKPQYDFNNMTRLATLNVKWLYQKYGIYTQVIIPERIFQKTFTPKLMLKTKTGKERKLNFKVRSLEEYLNLQNENTI